MTLLPEQTAAFDKFWKAWPRHHRKKSKGKCQHVWKKDKLEAKVDHVLAVLESMKAKWLEDRNKYVPAPLVWLNQQRWDCDLEDLPDKRDRHCIPIVREIADKLRTQEQRDQHEARRRINAATPTEQRAVVAWAVGQTHRETIGTFAAYLTKIKYDREQA